MPGWDNTPRGQDRSHVFVNAEPANYGRWLSALVERARASCERERPIFVNAWNEWGEERHLAPDARYGRAFLEASARARLASETASPNIAKSSPNLLFDPSGH